MAEGLQSPLNDAGVSPFTNQHAVALAVPVVKEESSTAEHELAIYKTALARSE